MSVPLPREWRLPGHVFLASSCLTPNKGICHLIRNKVDYWIEQPVLLCLAIDLSQTDMHGQKRRGC